MSSTSEFITQKYTSFRQALVLPSTQFKNVDLISYHLPKTAGTSLYLALEEAYGINRIKRVYDTEALQRLTQGNALWVPRKTLVLHGHFRPHANHLKQYPHARRMVWVRDPIERCWSLLRHWLRLENGPIYARFKAKHMPIAHNSAEELFDLLVNDPEFSHITNFYQSFFQHMAPGHFNFIAKAEEFDDELNRLSAFLYKPLKPHLANQNPKDAHLPFSKEKYASIFKNEYAFLSEKFSITYPLS